MKQGYKMKVQVHENENAPIKNYFTSFFMQSYISMIVSINGSKYGYNFRKYLRNILLLKIMFIFLLHNCVHLKIAILLLNIT